MGAGYDVNKDGEYSVIHGTIQGDYTHFDDMTTPTFNFYSNLLVDYYRRNLPLLRDAYNSLRVLC